MSGERVSAWWISIDAPPGYANSCRTPSRSSACTRMSAPLRGSLPKRSSHSCVPAACQGTQLYTGELINQVEDAATHLAKNASHFVLHVCLLALCTCEAQPTYSLLALCTH